MAFSMRRARAVFWKDFLDLRKNSGLLWTLAVLPLVQTLVPVGVVYAYARDPNDPSFRTMALYYDPTFPAGGKAAVFLIERTLIDWFGLFLVMPMFIPILISAQSVAGEKERRTIEPLLASPVTAAEILAGKSAASLIPAVSLSTLAFAILCILVDWVTYPIAGELILPNSMWLVGVLGIAPLFAFFGNVLAIVISARVADARMAQQVAGLFTLPLLGLVGLQIAGFLKAGSAYYAALGAVVFLADVVLMVVAIRLFDRERLISRWG